jgi:hypothetical protein
MGGGGKGGCNMTTRDGTGEETGHDLRAAGRAATAPGVMVGPTLVEASGAASCLGATGAAHTIVTSPPPPTTRSERSLQDTALSSCPPPSTRTHLPVSKHYNALGHRLWQTGQQTVAGHPHQRQGPHLRTTGTTRETSHSRPGDVPNSTSARAAGRRRHDGGEGRWWGGGDTSGRTTRAVGASTHPTPCPLPHGYLGDAQRHHEQRPKVQCCGRGLLLKPLDPAHGQVVVFRVYGLMLRRDRDEHQGTHQACGQHTQVVPAHPTSCGSSNNIPKRSIIAQRGSSGSTAAVQLVPGCVG